MPTVLITGANRGLGLEFARQYGAGGWRVIATCRDPAKAETLSASEGDIRIEALDVDDGASVDSLADKLKGESIDVLINNAGVYGPRGLTARTMDYEAWGQALRTNTMSPFRVSAAFTPQVVKSQQKVIATISSRLGSMGENQDGRRYIYRSSKAALNAVMKGLAIDLAGDGIRMVLLHPGWVSTDLGGPNAPVKADESVAGMRRVIAGLKEDETGVFVAYDGAALSW